MRADGWLRAAAAHGNPGAEDARQKHPVDDLPSPRQLPGNGANEVKHCHQDQHTHEFEAAKEQAPLGPNIGEDGEGYVECKGAEENEEEGHGFCFQESGQRLSAGPENVFLTNNAIGRSTDEADGAR